MLIVKAIQIRDEATSIPAVAWRFAPTHGMTVNEYRIMRRAGFSDPAEYVILTRLTDMEAQYDPFKWAGGARTMKVAHLLLQGRLNAAACKELGILPIVLEMYSFDDIKSGVVLDVGHALGLNEQKEFE